MSTNEAAKDILRSILADIGIAPPADVVSNLSTERPDNLNTVVGRMLFENPEEKHLLARAYAEQTARADQWWEDSGDHSAFVESGSTVLYVIHQLLPKLKNMADKDKLLLKTNNNLAARLLLTREISPFLFSGYLENKYHGIFPFHTKDAVRRSMPIDQRTALLEEERVQYAQCRLALTQCRTLMLAASRLSLVNGPMVGSRENAIFKNATYNSCVPSLRSTPRTNVYLYITPQKLVGHNPENKNPLGEQGTPLFHTMKEEIDKINAGKCFPVFDIDEAQVAESERLQPWPSPFSADLCQDVEVERLKDDTSAVRMGEGRFRICRTWSDLFVKAGLRICVFLFCSSDAQVNWVDAEIMFAEQQHVLAIQADRIKDTTRNNGVLYRIQITRK